MLRIVIVTMSSTRLYPRAGRGTFCRSTRATSASRSRDDDDDARARGGERGRPADGHGDPLALRHRLVVLYRPAHVVLSVIGIRRVELGPGREARVGVA